MIWHQILRANLKMMQTTNKEMASNLKNWKSGPQTLENQVTYDLFSIFFTFWFLKKMRFWSIPAPGIDFCLIFFGSRISLKFSDFEVTYCDLLTYFRSQIFELDLEKLRFESNSTNLVKIASI